MDTKQKQRLKNALKGAGLSVGLADSYEGLDDDALENVIKGLEAAKKPKQPTMEEIIESDAFSEFMEEGGFETMLSKNKAAQSKFDSKMDKGFNTRLRNWLDKDGEGSGGQGDKNKVDVPEGTPDWAKAIIESNKALKEEVDSLKSARKGEKTLEQAKVLLGKSKLPDNIQERWLSRINVSSDDSLEDQVKALETEWGEINPGGDEGAGAGSGSGDYSFKQGDKNKQGKLDSATKESLGEFAKSFKVN